jgi:hypothetical protein
MRITIVDMAITKPGTYVSKNLSSFFTGLLYIDLYLK